MKPPILIADDDPDAREALRLRLFHHGLTAVAVGSGGEAIAAYEAIRPRVVLLDASMPGVSGFEVCRHIKEQSQAPSATVVFVTGATRGNPEYIGRCARLSGGDHLVSKPYDAAQLVRLVRDIESGCRSDAEPADPVDKSP